MKKAYRIGILAIVTLFLAVSFNNCAQPKFSELDQKSLSSLSTDLNQTSDEPVIPEVPKKIVTKSKVLDIKESSKIDVLFVIDNSGSMAYEQKNMGERFASFFSKIDMLKWRIGIVTTDAAPSAAELKDGKLIRVSNLGGRRWLDSELDSRTSAEINFKATIQRSENGSGNEEGIRAAHRAIERDAANDINVGFFRSDAALAVIVISDDDESPNDAAEKISGYKKSDVYKSWNYSKNLVQTVATRWPGKAFLINAIVVQSGDMACLKTKENDNSNESYGTEYEEGAKLTGGVIGSVCANDYSEQLGDIGTGVAEAVKSVSLECVPIDGDGDGVLDLEIRNSGNQLLNNYSIKGSLITFSDQLTTGMTTIRYNCYQ